MCLGLKVLTMMLVHHFIWFFWSHGVPEPFWDWLPLQGLRVKVWYFCLKYFGISSTNSPCGTPMISLVSCSFLKQIAAVVKWDITWLWPAVSLPHSPLILNYFLISNCWKLVVKHINGNPVTVGCCNYPKCMSVMKHPNGDHISMGCYNGHKSDNWL